MQGPMTTILKDYRSSPGPRTELGLGPARDRSPIELGPGERPGVRKEDDGCGCVLQPCRQRARFFDFGPGRLNGGCEWGRCFCGG